MMGIVQRTDKRSKNVISLESAHVAIEPFAVGGRPFTEITHNDTVVVHYWIMGAWTMDIRNRPVTTVLLP